MGVGAWCCNADGWMGLTDHTLQTVTTVQEHLPCLRYKAKQFILCLQEKNKCAKEILRLKLRRRWPQRNIRAVWFLFLESSLPRLSRSLCWPWLCDFVWKCDFVWPKYFPLSYFDNVLALGSRLPRTHSGRRTHWCPILNRTSQLSDYSLVFVWLPLVILYAWWPSNDVQEHDICHHLR